MSGQVSAHLELPCDRTGLLARRQAQGEDPWPS